MLNTTQGKLLNTTIKPVVNTKTYLVTVNRKFSRSLAAVFAATLLYGCAVTPTSIVNQPTTARAPSIGNVANNNGGIYNAASYRPMFEDHRPRFIGDIVTINITENTSATKANGSSGSKEGSVSFDTNAKLGDNIPVVGGLVSRLPFAKLGSASASSDNSYTTMPPLMQKMYSAAH